jgi:hypothetical protein
VNEFKKKEKITLSCTSPEKDFLYIIVFTWEFFKKRPTIPLPTIHYTHNPRRGLAVCMLSQTAVASATTVTGSAAVPVTAASAGVSTAV